MGEDRPVADVTADGPAACRWCGAIHGPICPHVRAYEFGPEGEVLRVEFFSPAEVQIRPAAPQTPDYPRKSSE